MTDTNQIAPETKNIDDVAQSFGDFMRSFDEYKRQNDDNIAQLKKGTGLDILATERLDRINAALDEQKRALDSVILKRERPPLHAGQPAFVSLEHKGAFNDYVRRGDESGLRGIEAKAHSVNSAPDGGYLVPAELETEIGRRLAQISPIRALASVRQVSSMVLKKPFSIKGPAVGWVGETEARPQTETSVLAEMQFPTMELYAMPAATSSLLDDGAVDVEQWISTEVETAFAEQEGRAFVTGDGVNKPRGFLNYNTAEEKSWEWGKIGTVLTGAEGAFIKTGESDVLFDTIYTLKAGYRKNANWIMNRRTQAAIRKLKDADGNYLWSPPAAPGEQASLLGFGVTEAEDMPDIGPGIAAIAFGDFARGYLVVDRVGVRVLRDPYSAKPYVLFYTTKRVGGGVQDFDAIKLLVFAG